MCDDYLHRLLWTYLGMWGLEWVCFVLFFCSPASIKKEEMAEGLWGFFSIHVRQPIGKGER